VLEEATARGALFQCAADFSPLVEDRSAEQEFLCVIDISGTEKLFGQPAHLAGTLSEQVRGLGFTASIAVSSNFEAAICLARGISKRTITITGVGTEAIALAPLPITVPALPKHIAETLASWGIHTLGMLATLSEEALISRLGQTAKRLSLLARGEMPHHFVPIEAAFTLAEHIELDTAAELLESLLVVMSVMLEQVIQRAASRILALASITVTLQLEGSRTHVRTIRPPLPSTDRKLWLKLIRLDLEAYPPDKPITAITVAAETGSLNKVQLGLFSPQLPEPINLDITLRRIKCIVGENSVGCAVLEDKHKPDSFKVVPFDITCRTLRPNQSSTIKTATRKLRPPVSLSIKLNDQRPSSFLYEKNYFKVEQAYGPWNLSGEWWSAKPWSYEQWDLVCRAPGNRLLCCCIQHERFRQTWQLTMLYD
jgi:protein ImuB